VASQWAYEPLVKINRTSHSAKKQIPFTVKGQIVYYEFESPDCIQVDRVLSTLGTTSKMRKGVNYP
jgi:hypothetical protein